MRKLAAALLLSSLSTGACDHKSGTTEILVSADGGSDDGSSDSGDICRNAARGVECAPAVCLDSHTLRLASSCDGKGNCNVGAQHPCDPLLCVAASCPQACVDSSGCPNGSACINGSCQARRPNGQVCAVSAECVSGFCSPDQVCCDTACAGTCMACSADATGQATGTCAPVRAGVDPRDDCPIDTAESCGRNGSCDGAGRCALYGGGTQCAAAFCDSGGRFVAARMCGGGACTPAAPEDCGLATCEAASGCRRTCAGDGDCTASGYCDAHAGTCTPKKANGASCGAAHECATGNCVDGVCCDTACAAVCVSCRAAENGRQSDGTCGEVVDGTDPENECAPAAEACGTDGFCGHGRCRLAPSNVTCGAPVCLNAPGNTSATLTPAATCDGQGVCGTPSPVPCPGSVLCLSDHQCGPITCSNDADCISGFYCASGTCTAQQVIGAMCSANDQCMTGACSDTTHADAVCCGTACTFACQGCTLASTGLPTGTCAPRLANATTVCGGACAQGYAICSSGLSCQPTEWSFDTALSDSSAPFNWGPDSQSAVLYSTSHNHTPGGNGSLGVLAGSPWDATPSVVLCGNDPTGFGYVTMDIGGKALEAWVQFDGPSTVAVCFFHLGHPFGGPDDIRALGLLTTDRDTWYRMPATATLAASDVVQLGVRCVLDDNWQGTLYIDDVSAR